LLWQSAKVKVGDFFGPFKRLDRVIKSKTCLLTAKQKNSSPFNVGDISAITKDVGEF
jgi:hypothetical protein